MSDDPAVGPVVDACAAFQIDPAHDVWQQKWDVREWYGCYRTVPIEFGPTAEQEFRRFYFRHTATGRVPVVLTMIIVVIAHLFALIGDATWPPLRIVGVLLVVIALCVFATPSRWLLGLVTLPDSGLSQFDAMVLRDGWLATLDECRAVTGLLFSVAGEAIFAAYVAITCETDPICYYRLPTILILTNAVWSMFLDVRWSLSAPALLLSSISFALTSLVNAGLRQPERAVPFVVALTLFAAPAIAAARVRENRLRERFQSIVEAQYARDVIQHHDEIMWRLIRLVAPRSLWTRLRNVASVQQAVLIDHSRKALVAVASVPRMGAWASHLVPMDVVRAMHAVFCRFDYEVHRARQTCTAIDRVMIAGDTYIVVGNLVGHGVHTRRGRRTGDSVLSSGANDSAGSPVSRRSTSNETTPAFLHLCLALRDVAEEVRNHPMVTQNYKLSYSGQPFYSPKLSDSPFVQPSPRIADTLNLCIGVGYGKCWGGIHGHTSRFRYLLFGDALNDALKLQQEGPPTRSSILVSQHLSRDSFGSLNDFSDEVLPSGRYFVEFPTLGIPCWEIVDHAPEQQREAEAAFDASLRSAPPPGDPTEDEPALRFGFADETSGMRTTTLNNRLPQSAASIRDLGGLQGFSSTAPVAAEPEPQPNPQYDELVSLVEDFRIRAQRSTILDAFEYPETAAAFDEFAVAWDRKNALLVWSAQFLLPVLVCIAVFTADIQTSAGTSSPSVNATKSSAPPTKPSTAFEGSDIATLILWSASAVAGAMTLFVGSFHKGPIPQAVEVGLTYTPIALFIAGMCATTVPTLLTSTKGFLLQIFAPIVIITGRRQSWPLKVIVTLSIFIATVTVVVLLDSGSQTFSRSLFAAFSGVLYLFFAWKMCSMNRDQFLSALLSTLFLNAAKARIATREKLLGGFVPQFLLDSIARRIASRDDISDGFPPLQPSHHALSDGEGIRNDGEMLESHTAGTVATNHSQTDRGAANKDPVPCVSKLEFRHQSVGGSFWQRCLQQPDEKMITPWGELCVASIQFHPLAFDVERALFRLHAGQGVPSFDVLNNSVGMVTEARQRADLDISFGLFPSIGNRTLQEDRTLLQILAEVDHPARDDGTLPSAPTPQLNGMYETSQLASVAPHVQPDPARPAPAPAGVAALPPVFEAMLSVLDTIDVAIAEHDTAFLRVVRVVGDNVMIAGPIGEPKEAPSANVEQPRRHQLDDLNPRAPDEIAKKQTRIMREKHVLQAAESLVQVLQALHARGGRTFTAALAVDSAIGAVVGDEATTIHHCILGVATRTADALLNAAPLLDSSAGPIANRSAALALETFRRTHDRLLIASAAQEFVKKHFAVADLERGIAPTHLGESRTPSNTLNSNNPLAAVPPPSEAPAALDTFNSAVFGTKMRWSVKKLGNVDVYPVKLSPVSLQCSRPTSRVSDARRQSLDDMCQSVDL